MAGELRAAGGVHHLLLGELNAFATDSPHRTSVAGVRRGAARERALPRATPGRSTPTPPRTRLHREPDPVATLEAALDARGGVRRARAASGSPRPAPARRTPAGRGRRARRDERAGCLALGRAARRAGPPTRACGAVFQYSFREDPGLPGRAAQRRSRTRLPDLPAVARLHARERARASAPPAPAALCA